MSKFYAGVWTFLWLLSQLRPRSHGTASFTRKRTSLHIVPKSGTLVGCVQTGTLQIETTKTVIRKVERHAILPFRSRLNGQMENMSTEGLRSRPNTKQNCKAILPFPCEQPICSLQKLERRWIGTIAFVCEHKLVISLKKLKQNKLMHPFTSPKLVRACSS